MTSARPIQPVASIALFATGVLATGVLGALTNSINGWVSAQYFINIMHWQDVDDIWRASIAQGIFEGLVSGLILSAIFTVAVGVISQFKCSFASGIRYVLGILGVAFLGWISGGLLAVMLAWSSPEFYRHAFISVPSETGVMLKYAWVGGSIVGLQIGGFLSTIFGLAIFRSNWKRQIQIRTKFGLISKF